MKNNDLKNTQVAKILKNKIIAFLIIYFHLKLISILIYFPMF